MCERPSNSYCCQFVELMPEFILTGLMCSDGEVEKVPGASKISNAPLLLIEHKSSY